ncbi:ABC transporter permease OS=Streptomyces glaucescens OX=1907 GN=bldKC2 PE=3 SV=1 [Streptomyces glaucescens]
MQIYFLGPLALAILVYQMQLFDKAYNEFTKDPSPGSAGWSSPG